MTDERPDGDERPHEGPMGAPGPEADGPALFPTEGLAPGEDVESGRLADLATEPAEPANPPASDGEERPSSPSGGSSA